MSESLVEQVFRRQVENELSDLKNDGWEPLPAEQVPQLHLPEGVHPDIIVRKGAETLVVQCKSRGSKDLQDLEELARFVSTKPNTRLELRWLGDVPELDPDKDLIREYARNASALLHSGYARAAVLMAWSAAEGALVRYAGESRAPLPGGEPLGPQQAWPLASQLYSVGYIADDDYERIRRLRAERNRVAHFAGSEPPDSADVEFVLDVIDRMLSGRYSRAGGPAAGAAAAVDSADPHRRLASRTSGLLPPIAISAIVQSCLDLANTLTHTQVEEPINASRAQEIVRRLDRAREIAPRYAGEWDHARDRALLLAFDITRDDGRALTAALELARDIAHSAELSIAADEIQDVVGQLPVLLFRSVTSSLDLACEFAHDHAFRSSLNREISLMASRSAELTRILSEAMSRELGIEPVEGLAAALLDHALDDFTDADLSDADLSDVDLQGLRWSDRTEWPSEMDIDDLRSRSVENPPGSGIYTIASTSESQDDGDQIRVHAVYLGARVEGIYHPSTQLIDIVSGPVPHTSGLKPSPAAGGVIRALNEAEGKQVTGSRNGWEFWVVTATGQLLQSERPGAPQGSS